jgi:hypothetical protein
MNNPDFHLFFSRAVDNQQTAEARTVVFDCLLISHRTCFFFIIQSAMSATCLTSGSLPNLNMPVIFSATNRGKYPIVVPPPIACVKNARHERNIELYRCCW